MPLTPDEVRAILDRHRWRAGEREKNAMADIAENAVSKTPRRSGSVQPAKAEPPMMTKQHAMSRASADDRVRNIGTTGAASFARRCEPISASQRKSWPAPLARCSGIFGKVTHDALDEVRQELLALKQRARRATRRNENPRRARRHGSADGADGNAASPARFRTAG